mmetsp:Transcript_25939/g.61537  ORF Transcript_25939/g.61537 Transcript_25939/m.61537 type:complete len:179 (+) Transcript_25939:162-698(+)
MVTVVPNGTVSLHRCGGGDRDGDGGVVVLNDQKKVVQYPNGDTVCYSDYLDLVRGLNPDVPFPKTGWVLVTGDQLAVKLTNEKHVYTEQQMDQSLAAARERVKRYRATPHGRKKRNLYRERHRECQRRYAASDKGKAKIEKYNEYIRSLFTTTVPPTSTAATNSNAGQRRCSTASNSN